MLVFNSHPYLSYLILQTNWGSNLCTHKKSVWYFFPVQTRRVSDIPCMHTISEAEWPMNSCAIVNPFLLFSMSLDRCNSTWVLGLLTLSLAAQTVSLGPSVQGCILWYSTKQILEEVKVCSSEVKAFPGRVPWTPAGHWHREQKPLLVSPEHLSKKKPVSFRSNTPVIPLCLHKANKFRGLQA